MKKSGLSRYVGSILIFAGLFFVYALITDIGKLLNPLIFPGLGKIFRALISSRKLLFIGFLSSMRLLFPALLLAIVLGVSIGAVVGLNEKLKRLFMPIFSALNPIPPTMLIPYAIAIFPTFWLSSASIIMIGVFWPVLRSTIHGIIFLEPRWIDNARCLNLKGAKLVFKIILPGIMPQIFAGIESGLIMSFILLTVGEIFGARAGLGYFVQYYADFAEYDRVLAGMFVLSLVVLLITLGFNRLKTRVLYWTKKR
ncbi:MAG: ABC transporter permease subunit [Spirochaetaceae bacterium]|jgi:NitT/TauT family transport system permease protein|nr:ABC transporter permease subunit [Spirochaetaceae bacterium]